jgi:hypothetical protein
MHCGAKNEQRFNIRDRLTEADKRISSSLMKSSSGLMEKIEYIVTSVS